MRKPLGESLYDLCEGLGMPAPRRGSFDRDGCSTRDGTQHGKTGNPWLPHELVGLPEGAGMCEYPNDAAKRFVKVASDAKRTDANKLATSLGSTSMDFEAVVGLFWARSPNDDIKHAMLCADPKHKGKNTRLHLVSKTHAECAASTYSAMIALHVISFLT